ncbi:nucleoporin complex subunit 54-domain-containing protein [Lasiosphaeria miniovina]|uniref:Nucleoporin complex subunit 54-domain-containing protein n=1 Tax=Lasiosphaeria miniovina TaxID=1954250 RepID=A0AA40AK60_9PEZI|nr:nucleoporin complex subunit 54-domain-containing protein [Lasiosphaeria miniovina]KAK0717362.1 nucleoporin complex subunit 54-domain-containing protein [Lasiosphaeria miniovina]
MFSSSNFRPAGQSVFAGGNTGGFGQPLANQNQQQQQQTSQQQQQQQTSQQQQQQLQPGAQGLGQLQANPNQQQLGNSLWQPGSLANYQKPIPEQIKMITDKWDPSNPNCVFKTYLYNKVDEHAVPLYGPQPNDDPKEWEEALQQKPAPNYIPVLCAGFPSIVARLVLQRRVITEYNNKLHAINASLDEILSRHDLEHSVRALKARRRHAEISKRCLTLASKVQVMRNRGYAMSSDEDELKQKLQKIDKSIQDPALSARMEELWSRLIILRGYADNLKDELNKPGLGESDGLSEEIEARAKKILEDYEKQLQHLKKQVEEAKKDFQYWEKEHNPTPAPSRASSGK